MKRKQIGMLIFLAVIVILLFVTANTSGVITDPENYQCGVYATVFALLPPVIAISSIHLLLIGNEEALEKRKNLWGDIKTSNPKLYYKLKYASLSGWTDLPGAVGRRLTIGGYRLANAVYRFQ